MNTNLTHMVISHPLHQRLDLARKCPEKEKISVLWKHSAQIFPPTGPVLEVSVALSPLHELTEILKLKDKEALTCSESHYNK